MKTVFGNIKGGVGKSLLACNAAVVLGLGRRQRSGEVLLIDGDVQASSTAFTDVRAETMGGDIGYDCVSMRGTAIRSQMPSIERKYDDIVIDCGGQDNPSLRAAMTIADRLVVPLPPRSVDEWALEKLFTLIGEVTDLVNTKLQTMLLINMADPQGSDNEAVKSAIRADYFNDADALPPGTEIVDPVIVRRKAFPDAFADGRSIVEHRPADRKGIDELLSVMAVVYTNDRKGIDDGHTTESTIARCA